MAGAFLRASIRSGRAAAALGEDHRAVAQAVSAIVERAATERDEVGRIVEDGVIAVIAVIAVGVAMAEGVAERGDHGVKAADPAVGAVRMASRSSGPHDRRESPRDSNAHLVRGR